MAPFRVVDAATVATHGTPQFYLLGLMHGHFDVPDVNADVVTERIGEQNFAINTGIGIVIPATKILDLLNGSIPQRRREELAQAHYTQGSTTPDA